jgi:hypothetical protein
MEISVKLYSGKENKNVLVVPTKLKLNETEKSIKKPLGDWLQPISFANFGKGKIEVCIDGSIYERTMNYAIMPAEIRKGALAEILQALATHVGLEHEWILDFIKNTTTRPLSKDEIENRLFTRALGVQTNASLNASLTKEAAKENAVANLDDVQYAVWVRREEIKEQKKEQKKLEAEQKKLEAGK